MDVRTRVAACRLLEKMQKNPPAAERLGLVDSSKNFSKVVMIEKRQQHLTVSQRVIRRKEKENQE